MTEQRPLLFFCVDGERLMQRPYGEKRGQMRIRSHS